VHARERERGASLKKLGKEGRKEIRKNRRKEGGKEGGNEGGREGGTCLNHGGYRGEGTGQALT